MITAIRRMAARTPSEGVQDVLRRTSQASSRAASASRRFCETSTSATRRKRPTARRILEHLATIAEAYVTVLVAGVLFLITILLVFGLTTTDTLRFIQLLGYVMVPLANVGFMVYLAQKLESLGIAANHTTSVLDSTETRSPRPVGHPRWRPADRRWRLRVQSRGPVTARGVRRLRAQQAVAALAATDAALEPRTYPLRDGSHRAPLRPPPGAARVQRPASSTSGCSTTSPSRPPFWSSGASLSPGRYTPTAFVASRPRRPSSSNGSRASTGRA